MDASIIICTRNRAASLARTLSSIVAAKRPDRYSFQVVIVDNGSTDNTSLVIEDFNSLLPLTLIKEPKPGLSNARNRGVTAAQGQYIIWTDDDVLVEPNWLSAYANAFERWPNAAAFGGKILPVLEKPISPWFATCQQEFNHLLAARDFGPKPVKLAIEEDRLPFGANYVIRAAEQRLFPYDPELGVAPNRNRMGEETAVVRAVLASGATGYYVPESAVRHMIPAGRQTIAYVRAYYRGHGETAAMSRPPHTGRRVAGLPPWVWRQLASETVVYSLERVFSPPSAWVPHLKKLAYWQGYITGLKARDA